MRMINYRPPYRDELVFGWIMEIMKLNRAGDIRYPAARFGEFFLQEAKLENLRQSYAYMPNLESRIPLLQKVGGFPEPSSFIVNNTPFHIFAFLRTKSKQAFIIERMLRIRYPEMYSIGLLPNDIGDLKFCPKCREEEGEGAYYKVWHNLPGVEYCFKHKSRLLTLNDKAYKPLLYLSDDIVCMQEKTMDTVKEEKTKTRYAAFLYDIYKNPIPVSFELIRSVILSFVKERKEEDEDYLQHLEDENDKSGIRMIMDSSAESVINEIYEFRCHSCITLFCLLLLVFGDAKSLNERIRAFTTKNGVYTDADESESFKRLTGLNYITGYECKICGNAFLMHPFAGRINLGCPHCSQKYDIQEFSERLLSSIGDGNYHIQGDTTSFSKQTHIEHRTCGKIRIKTLSSVIGDQSACTCERCLNMEDAQKKIDERGLNYEITGQSKKPHRPTVYTLCHRTCGGSFGETLGSFLPNPICRCCGEGSWHYRNVEKDARELFGNDYKVEKIDLPTETMTVTHLLCGTQTKGSITAFRNGKKCELCSPPMDLKTLKLYIENRTDGQYKIIGSKGTKVWLADHNGEIKTGYINKMLRDIQNTNNHGIFNVIDNEYTLLSKDAKLFLAIREWCGSHAVWLSENHLEEFRNEMNTYRVLQRLVDRNLVKKVWKGAYSVREDATLWDVIKEKYISDGEMQIGCYKDKALAYHFGLVDNMPKVIHIMSNRKISGSDVNVTIGDIKLRVMPPPIAISNQNIDAITGILLVEYAYFHPGVRYRIAEFLKKEHISLARMKLYINDMPKLTQSRLLKTTAELHIT